MMKMKKVCQLVALSAGLGLSAGALAGVYNCPAGKVIKDYLIKVTKDFTSYQQFAITRTDDPLGYRVTCKDINSKNLPPSVAKWMQDAGCDKSTNSSKYNAEFIINTKYTPIIKSKKVWSTEFSSLPTRVTSETPVLTAMGENYLCVYLGSVDQGPKLSAPPTVILTTNN